jgi:predicted lipid-binding transport protein (Tim44 family)
VLWLVGLFVVGALCGVAAARPGGGHSYSGGGHSYSGGGGYRSSGGSYRSSGGGGGDASGMIGILAIAIVIVVIIAVANSAKAPRYTSSYSPPQPLRALDAATLVARDPGFSRPVFEDFVFRLFSAAHRARGDRNKLAALAPYLGPSVLDRLAQRSGGVEQVVIGSLHIADVSVDPSGASSAAVAVEANVAGATGTTNVVERWTFVREPGVTSRPPERTRALACPNCGAPFVASSDPRRCSHCNEVISVGRFDWTLTDIRLDAETRVGPTLTGTVAEIGNDFPTVTEPAAQATLMQLRQDDPNVTWDAFKQRLTLVYARLNDAWNGQELTPVRGLVTSSLQQYLQYWIDEYKRQQLGNHLDNAAIDHVALAKVTRDSWFDAITVRVYARGNDYTLDKGGRVVGGSKSDVRAYTEYWTFLRSSARKGPITTSPSCPNCGAPLAISDTGACTHCGAQIENASFDWTLSKIEQDDVYRG